ncbi:unnamed protein product [Dovyalis caffra]|uniref:Uncharacterized protein n=1 Tax=Dovyalis caffra TaxID=77055 RepID=A0AAV1QZG7_9ROSI|nr:unnamed protein product [Dovyalis caffra]
MENATNIYHHDCELEPDQDLSFGDLPLFIRKEPERNNYYHDDQEPRNSFSSQDFFEFLPPEQDTETNPAQDIIFFGRHILPKTKQSANSPNPSADQTNSHSPFNSSAHLSSNRSRRSHSLQFETAKPSPTPPSTGSFRDQYYSSNNSRKHKVLIGLAKIPPKMELSDIKKRQSRQAPAPMIPTAVLAVDEKPLVDGSNRSGLDHPCIGSEIDFRNSMYRQSIVLLKRGSECSSNDSASAY